MKNHAFAELCILLVHSYYHSIMDLLFLAVKIEIYPKTGTLVHYNAILCFLQQFALKMNRKQC